MAIGSLNGRGQLLLTGLVVGAATLALAPVLLPAIARVGRPIAKAAIKGVILAWQTTQETVAELAEAAEDMLAEARAELEQETAEQAGGPGAAAAGEARAHG
ncbi:MAG: DUF5132 domain-containing protein [Geminicoccaceae bacterium]|nr:DUF5132 domain-containing protein [Geminicoccaceae bacterium]MCS7268424.1 DUF5132 domain-containing protein [Geminicoccaceae bacterium]MDW8124923.1 DUF5132 domain-containing protein [Geminicoccaceae bacterium]MDW8340971.1 DUF5132 domain-containing protein [Geminicoccaceae bacterium]